jgi:hypothetical protein
LSFCHTPKGMQLNHLQRGANPSIRLLYQFRNFHSIITRAGLRKSWSCCFFLCKELGASIFSIFIKYVKLHNYKCKWFICHWLYKLWFRKLNDPTHILNCFSWSYDFFWVGTRGPQSTIGLLKLSSLRGVKVNISICTKHLYLIITIILFTHSNN